MRGNREKKSDYLNVVTEFNHANRNPWYSRCKPFSRSMCSEKSSNRDPATGSFPRQNCSELSSENRRLLSTTPSLANRYPKRRRDRERVRSKEGSVGTGVEGPRMSEFASERLRVQLIREESRKKIKEYRIVTPTRKHKKGRGWGVRKGVGSQGSEGERWEWMTGDRD